jgi:hypothetical protein
LFVNLPVNGQAWQVAYSNNAIEQDTPAAFL